jgi:anaerobic selenocysteine-containing dehydrogenase
MNDYLICARLAERLGHGHLYPRDEDDMVEYVIADLPFNLGEFKERSSLGPISLDPESDRPSFAIRAEEKKWLSGALRPDGEPGFPTASGKWEIASSLLASFGHAALPRYEGLKEGPENKELVAEFPLTLTTGTRIQTTFRSQHLNIPGLLKRQPNAEALIHPQDAEPRRISTGDKVRITTPRGAVTFTARVTEDIMQGVVEANQGGGSPIQGEGWKNSNVNFLTDDKHRDPISGFPVFKALLCEVEKV